MHLGDRCVKRHCFDLHANQWPAQCDVRLCSRDARKSKTSALCKQRQGVRIGVVRGPAALSSEQGLRSPVIQVNVAAHITSHRCEACGVGTARLSLPVCGVLSVEYAFVVPQNACTIAALRPGLADTPCAASVGSRRGRFLQPPLLCMGAIGRLTGGRHDGNSHA